jgi:hypothetical protein
MRWDLYAHKEHTFGVNAEVRDKAVEAPLGFGNESVNKLHKFAADQLALLMELCPRTPERQPFAFFKQEDNIRGNASGFSITCN